MNRFIHLTSQADENEKFDQWSNLANIESIQNCDGEASIRFVSGDYLETDMDYDQLIAQVRKLTELTQ